MKIANGTLGFTGTRNGTTPAQQITVDKILDRISPDWCVHGDAIGADTDFHNLARELGESDMIFDSRLAPGDLYRQFDDEDGFLRIWLLLKESEFQLLEDASYDRMFFLAVDLLRANEAPLDIFVPSPRFMASSDAFIRKGISTQWMTWKSQC